MDLRKSLIMATAALSVATAPPASAQRAADTAAKVEGTMRPTTSVSPSDSLTG